MYATAQAYEMDGGEKFVFYEGESEKITIQEGENALSLFLQKVESDIIRLYINETIGTEAGDGSKSKPFKTLAQACHEITDATKTYWFIVDGTLTGMQMLCNEIDNMAGKAIVLKGKSGNSTDIINGKAENRALIISIPVPVTIKNLTIKNGNADGDDGGGVYIEDSTVTIADGTIITGNAAQKGGGVYIADSVSTLNMTGGVISNNTANIGAGIHLFSGTFNMTGGEIKNNTASSSSSDGGGLWIGQWGKLTLSNAKITGNSATRKGGGIFIGDTNGNTHTISGSTISGNSVADVGGGGLYLESGTTNISNTVISSNSSNTGDGGGGIYCNATVTLDNVTFSGNQGNNGKDIYNGLNSSLRDTTISGVDIFNAV